MPLQPLELHSRFDEIWSLLVVWREKWPNRCCVVEIFSLATTHASSEDEDRRSEKSLLFEQAKWTFNRSSIEKMRVKCRRAATTARSRNSFKFSWPTWVNCMYMMIIMWDVALQSTLMRKKLQISQYTQQFHPKKKAQKSNIISSGKIMYSLSA